MEILKSLAWTPTKARGAWSGWRCGGRQPIATWAAVPHTLFDENAACHFALGSAYAENHVRGKDMTPEEKREAGMNDSITHVDFMVGGPQLQVTGVQPDGTQVPIFVDGNWVV